MWEVAWKTALINSLVLIGLFLGGLAILFVLEHLPISVKPKRWVQGDDASAARWYPAHKPLTPSERRKMEKIMEE